MRKNYEPAIYRKDISLSDFGRKELSIAETEMPGLMALRAEYGEKQTFERCAYRRLTSHDYSNSSFN